MLEKAGRCRTTMKKKKQLSCYKDIPLHSRGHRLTLSVWCLWAFFYCHIFKHSWYFEPHLSQSVVFISLWENNTGSKADMEIWICLCSDVCNLHLNSKHRIFKYIFAQHKDGQVTTMFPKCLVPYETGLYYHEFCLNTGTIRCMDSSGLLFRFI